MQDAMGGSVEVANTRHGYDAVAGAYATAMADELRGKPLDRALLDVVCELAAGDVIADVGCGPGQVTAHLASRGARAIGLDLSPVMCTTGARATSLPFCAAEMTALPIRSRTVAAIVSFYAVIHLGPGERVAAYREFARALRPGGWALIAFHTSDPDTRTGEVTTLTKWWGHEVALNFRFLDPVEELESLAAAGFELQARLDRAPYDGWEHPSQRCYLLLRSR
jgi:SAM-dependent methyltransferase